MSCASAPTRMSTAQYPSCEATAWRGCRPTFTVRAGLIPPPRTATRKSGPKALVDHVPTSSGSAGPPNSADPRHGPHFTPGCAHNSRGPWRKWDASDRPSGSAAPVWWVELDRFIQWPFRARGPTTTERTWDCKGCIFRPVRRRVNSHEVNLNGPHASDVAAVCGAPIGPAGRPAHTSTGTGVGSGPIPPRWIAGCHRCRTVARKVGETTIVPENVVRSIAVQLAARDDAPLFFCSGQHECFGGLVISTVGTWALLRAIGVLSPLFMCEMTQQAVSIVSKGCYFLSSRQITSSASCLCREHTERLFHSIDSTPLSL